MLDLNAKVVKVNADDNVAKQVSGWLSDKKLSGRRVGFVIALAGDAQPSQRAEDLSERVVAELRAELPAVFGDTASRAYWRGGRYGDVKLELFFFRKEGKR